MKKKIFSTLLMGTLFAASVGMFSSCKNYDDDISNLQGQIDKAALKSEVEAMQATLSTTSTNASSALTTAQSALTKANSGVTADQLAAVNTAAQNAGKDAATAIANAAAASKAASDAAAAAKAAQADADQKISDAVSAQQIQNANLNQQLIDLGKLVDTKVTADQLNQSLASLKNDIMSATEDNLLKELKTVTDNYDSQINALYSAVTGVSLISSYTGSGKEYRRIFYSNMYLGLMHGLQAADYKFGEKETYSPSAPIKEYKKGSDIDSLFETGLIVKVDPVNADLTTAKIILVNSQGKDMSDIIVAGKPQRYTDLITRETRSSNIESGLWQIPFHVKAGVTEEEFNEATTTTDNNYDEGARMDNTNNILFAVAINNTTGQPEGADRYVTSTYDIGTSYTAYQNANDFTFKVDDRELSTIHNRWNGSNTLADNGLVFPINNPEQAWKDGASSVITDNTKNDANDIRFSQHPYPVEVGKPFTITLDGNNAPQAEYYYVALDKANAQESSPSEWNAWSSYLYTGLFKTTKASDKLQISINSPEANGDVIGFRVFAVNYDGTLMDPDGKAFYVQVGDPANTNTVNANITANIKTASVIVPLTKSFASFSDNLSGPVLLDQASLAKMAQGASVNYLLCQDDQGTPASDWSNAKYVKISYSDAGLILDGSTLNGSVKVTDNIGRVVNTLNINVTKVMPTKKPSFSWKANQGPTNDGGTYICYVDPVSGWTANSATGSKYFKEAVNYDSQTSADDYLWTITNGISDSQDLVFSGNAQATVTQAKVDNDTKYATTLQYLYRGVSCTDVANTIQKDYPVAVWSGSTIFSCALDPLVQTYSWKSGFESQITYEQTGFTVDATTNLIGSNAYDNTQFGGTFKAQYIPGSYAATLTSNTNGNPDYFTVTFDGATFSFTRQSNTTNPTANVPSTLTVTATDAFGHVKTIATLPFTVLKKQ